MVHQHLAFQPGPLEQAHLQLVRHHGGFQPVLQRLDLRPGHVGHAQLPDLAFRHQLPDGGSHLRRVGQGVRAVQQEDVHVVRPQPLQAFVDPLQDGFAAEIVMGLQAAFIQPDPALGLQPDPVPESGRGGQHLAEHGFGLAAAVDVRMVEQCNPGIKGGLDGGSGLVHMLTAMRFVGPAAAQAHAAVA
jgi:hypothetical protein